MGKRFSFIIDRIEGDWVVLEYDGSAFDVPLALLPDDVKEGDVLKITLEIDRSETERRKEVIRGLEDELFE